MIGSLIPYYPFLKSLHLISIIMWIAGLVYLPLVYVYHCKSANNSSATSQFIATEQCMLRCFMNPAMILVFISGILLILATGAGAPGTGYWIHAKLVLVLGLAGIHGLMARNRKRLANSEFEEDSESFKKYSYITIVFMTLTILLAVNKPF